MDRILVMGSCFAAGIGQRLLDRGFDVCINPFGTLFNPVSIHQSLERLRNPVPFTDEDCVEMGAGAGLWGSFSHYTKFARPSRQEFLDNANLALGKAAEFYRGCSKMIITFGTAYCFRHKGRGCIVSNCLKRPAGEFDRFRLSVDEIVSQYDDIDKETVFTVSPIRHLADGAGGNQLSKATLLLACEAIVDSNPSRLHYFPSYEIMMDELRDYRWYAEDGVHPGEAATELIFNRFEQDFCKTTGFLDN